MLSFPPESRALSLTVLAVPVSPIRPVRKFAFDPIGFVISYFVHRESLMRFPGEQTYRLMYLSGYFVRYHQIDLVPIAVHPSEIFQIRVGMNRLPVAIPFFNGIF